jgi:thymidylate synthase ThyX
MNGANVQLTFDDAMDLTRQIEESFLIQGVKAEDARYVRPNAATTNITVSMNARELLHFLALRCTTPAQWEIRDMAWAMFACLKLVAPTIFRTLRISNTDSVVREKTMKLEGIVCGAYPIFTTAPLGTLIEIPLKELGLEHTVSAFVEKR